MSAARSTAPPTGEKPLVFPCLYTKQKLKKKKTFSDGYLTIHVSKNLCSLYSARDDMCTVTNDIMMNNIDSKQDSKYLSSAELALFTGGGQSSAVDVDIVFEAHLVQVTLPTSCAASSSSRGGSAAVSSYNGGGGGISASGTLATKLVAQPFKAPKFLPPKPAVAAAPLVGVGTSNTASAISNSIITGVQKGAVAVKGRYVVTCDELDSLWDGDKDDNDGTTSTGNATASLSSSGNDNYNEESCDIFSILQPVQPVTAQISGDRSEAMNQNSNYNYNNYSSNSSNRGENRRAPPLGLGKPSQQASFSTAPALTSSGGSSSEQSPASKKQRSGCGPVMVDDFFNRGSSTVGGCIGEDIRPPVNIFDSYISVGGSEDFTLLSAAAADTSYVKSPHPAVSAPLASIEWDF